MHRASPFRPAGLATAIIACTLISTQPARSDSITLAWADPYDNKALLIESGTAEKLFEGKLEGTGLVVQSDAMLKDGVASQQATINVQDHDEMAIEITLFRCGKPCDWRVTLTATETPNSISLNKICQALPRSLEGQYKKYFFCRSAYRFYVANDACWWETKAALTGWFDAAYNLHRLTLRDGIGFVTRDLEVEGLVKESLDNCADFEDSVRRRSGYFKAMMQNLDVVLLQQAQRVERSLVAQKPDEARIQAAEMIEVLATVEPLREKVPARDALYVEGVINRAIARDIQYMLR